MTAVRVTEVVPDSGDSFDAGTDAGQARLRERYARDDEAYVRLNMITTVTGAAAGADGTSDTLTSRVDRRILGVIRDDAQVVLVGAQTVRAEGYVVPTNARLAIVTASGDLAGARLGDGAGRVLVICTTQREPTVRHRLGDSPIDVAAVDAAELTPHEILAALAHRDLRRVVCEGGPGLASQFAAAGCIDEFCLTVAPVIAPTEHPFLRLDHAPRTEVAGMLVDDAGFSFLRLRALS